MATSWRWRSPRPGVDKGNRRDSVILLYMGHIVILCLNVIRPIDPSLVALPQNLRVRSRKPSKLLHEIGSRRTGHRAGYHRRTANSCPAFGVILVFITLSCQRTQENEHVFSQEICARPPSSQFCGPLILWRRESSHLLLPTSRHTSILD